MYHSLFIYSFRVIINYFKSIQGEVMAKLGKKFWRGLHTVRGGGGLSKNFGKIKAKFLESYRKF